MLQQVHEKASVALKARTAGEEAAVSQIAQVTMASLPWVSGTRGAQDMFHQYATVPCGIRSLDPHIFVSLIIQR